MPPSNNNRPAVDVSFVEPVLAGWGHVVVESSFSSSSSTSATCTTERSAGGIYLGPQQCAGKSVLADLRNADPPICAIVNCTGIYPHHHESDDVQYCRVPVDDDSSANILLYMDGTARFIHHHLISKGHSVLVHCQMGVSRSATIVNAYLMKYHGMSRDDAYKYVKERRPRINPNPGFWEQLLIYERRLLLEKANPTNASDQPSIAFDHVWAEKSMVKYQAIGHILEDKTEWFPEISPLADPQLVLSVALDYLFGRGVLEDDLKWLRSLCSVLSTLAVTCSPDEIIGRMLSGEDESEFSENWRGEITTRDIERIHESTHGT